MPSASARSSSPTSASSPSSGGGSEAGELPESLVLKTSVLLPCANPATARTLEELGATTINVSTDLSAAELGELRAACSAPLDVYVEVPDDQGGFVRFYEVPDVIRAAAPVYVKLGIRNAPNIYPAGLHLADTAVKLARERVRRAELVLRLLHERAPDLVEGRGEDAPADLGIPSREERFLGIYTAALADILDARGLRHQTLPTRIRPLAPGTKLAGRPSPCPARPSDAPEYDQALRKVLRMLGEVPAGHVAVYACEHEVSAHLGELSVTSLKSRGVAGCVLDGGCRDVRFILDEGFPVFCAHDARGLDVALGLEATQVPITVGSVRIEPGTGSSATTTVSSSSRRRSPRACSRRPRRRPRPRAEIRVAVRDGMTPLEAYERYGTF